MSGFLYFVPDLSRPASLADAAAFGLAHAFETQADLQTVPISGRTPNGGPGALLLDLARLGAESPGYNGTTQEWRPIPNSASWVGFNRHARPTAATLARREVMDGPLVKLADGGEWRIPLLRTFAGEEGFQPAYPLVADLDAEGNWVSGGTSPAAARMATLFDELFAAMAGEGASVAQALNWSCELLAINYVVSKIEVAALGLLETSAKLHAILRAATDWDRAVEWAQKKTGENAPAAAAG